MPTNKGAPWPGDPELFAFDGIPIGRDMFMIGSGQLEELKRQWARYLAEPDGTTPDHPNEFLNFRWCAIQDLGTESCDINVCITMTTRYHGAVRKLPRSKVVDCVRWYQYQKRAYLVVEQSWFDEIEKALFSVYALVDVVGMRQLLEKQGGIEQAQVSALKLGIGSIAESNPAFAFLTFADNVLIKSNWSAREGEYDRTYRPEHMLVVIEQVREVLLKAIGLDSYAVVTQGSNQYVEDGALQISGAQNHVFFGSLGSPFAHLFEIDQAIRKAIHEKKHSPAALYLAKFFLQTLHFKNFEEKTSIRSQLIPFNSKMSSVEETAYLPTDPRTFMSILRLEGEGVTGGAKPAPFAPPN